ncbi:hypothetical protein GCM10011491_41780 [Brucella endophytica]|uniref:Uncharacterized protein n=1 Tax=Brucella endophytica TaxID=1963359 RepID=A0A916SNE3_9HYPH|nr:hypothetical protein [Brucella endophytica]GGB09445.1 hypothetical protein GCM10011491_41780 [Brucella endophytica]
MVGQQENQAVDMQAEAITHRDMEQGQRLGRAVKEVWGIEGDAEHMSLPASSISPKEQMIAAGSSGLPIPQEAMTDRVLLNYYAEGLNTLDIRLQDAAPEIRSDIAHLQKALANAKSEIQNEPKLEAADYYWVDNFAKDDVAKYGREQAAAAHRALDKIAQADIAIAETIERGDDPTRYQAEKQSATSQAALLAVSGNQILRNEAQGIPELQVAIETIERGHRENESSINQNTNSQTGPIAEKYARIEKEHAYNDDGDREFAGWTVMDTTLDAVGEFHDNFTEDTPYEHVVKAIKDQGFTIETRKESERRHELLATNQEGAKFSDEANDMNAPVQQVSGFSNVMQRIVKVVEKISDSMRGDPQMKAAFDEKMQAHVKSLSVAASRETQAQKPAQNSQNAEAQIGVNQEQVHTRPQAQGRSR